MKKKLIAAIVSCFAIFIAYSCLDPYHPPASELDVRYLVVDGFLNSGEGSCTIKLSRTIPLTNSSKNPSPAENGAQVQLEDENGLTFTLTESTLGQYTIANITLDENKKYRLKILTKDNVEYRSDQVPIVQTPPIDDVNWNIERTGIPIHVSTHDPNNKTHYYSWKYTETWEYYSAFNSNLELMGGEIVYRNESIYKCWLSNNSTDILISSSNKLDQDVISQFTLTTIPWSSVKLSSKYSILVEQRAVTSDAFDYWQQIKKNTENLGTLFDPLPSTTTGNIVCVTNPAEPVLGYFSAGNVEKKRIFILRNEIKRPTGVPVIITGYESCTQDTIRLGVTLGTAIPITTWYDKNGFTLLGYYVSYPSCVDCQYAGGQNVPPDFWQ